MVMPRLNWRWLLALSSVPSFAVLLLYGLAPETPKYLCTAGKMADAAHVLEKMAQRNRTNLPSGMLVSDETATLDEEVIMPEHTPLLSSTVNKSGSSSFLMLLSSELIRTTVLLWFLFFGNSFVYYGVILLTSELNSEEARCGSTLLLLEHAQDASLYVNVFITSLAGKNAQCLLLVLAGKTYCSMLIILLQSFPELPGLLLSAVIVDRVGRKISMAIMSILTFIFLLPLLTHQPVTLTTVLLFGARMFANGTFTVASVYAPEVCPRLSSDYFLSQHSICLTCPH